MTIDITRPEDEILSGFLEDTRKKIRSAEKNLICKVYDLSQEKKDDIFVLLYAFYKDDAYTRRLKIPTYSEVFSTFNVVRKESTILLAYLHTVPIAALWVIRSTDVLHLELSGAVKLGYEHHADYFLLREAIRVGKNLEVQQVTLDAKKLFHGMMI
jgi:hypothetical protein